ncbi:hypothetical protein Moror_15571, partial [Moniliophthora roreri MCA 2997]
MSAKLQLFVDLLSGCIKTYVSLMVVEYNKDGDKDKAFFCNILLGAMPGAELKKFHGVCEVMLLIAERLYYFVTTVQYGVLAQLYARSRPGAEISTSTENISASVLTSTSIIEMCTSADSPVSASTSKPNPQKLIWNVDNSNNNTSHSAMSPLSSSENDNRADN